MEGGRTFSSALLGGCGAVGICQWESDVKHDSVLASAEHGESCLELYLFEGQNISRGSGEMSEERRIKAWHFKHDIYVIHSPHYYEIYSNIYYVGHRL